MRYHLLATLLLVACGSAAPQAAPATSSPAEADTYPILLSRRSQAGESYGEHTVHVQRQVRVVSVNGAVAQEMVEESTLELRSRVRVREVNELGQPTLLDHEITELVVRDQEHGERTIVPPGSVLRVTRQPRSEGEGSIELVGGQLDEADAETIDILFSTTISAVGDDGVFGTDERRRPGETWSIDAATAAQDLSKMPQLDLAEDQVSGQTTFERIEDVGGLPCMRIRAEMRAEGFAMAGMPEGTTIEHTELAATMTGAFPVDPGVERLEESEHLDMHMRMRLANGAVLDMRFDNTQTSEYER